MQLTKTIFNERHCDITYVGKVMQVSTHMTQGRVLRLRPLDLLRWMLTMNSTVLSDGPGLKHFNFEFGILHGPRQLVVKNAAGRRSALLPTHCLYSTEFPTRQETYQ